MSWNKTTRHFGDLIEGETVSFSFKYFGDKIYDRHSVSCGCIINHSWKDRVLTISWKPRDIPVAVLEANLNHYQVTKGITVFFSDNTSQTLYLKAIVYEE